MPLVRQFRWFVPTFVLTFVNSNLSFFLAEEAAVLDGVVLVGATLNVSTGLRALPLLRVGSGGGGGGGGLVRSRVVTMMMVGTDGIAGNVPQDSIQDTDTKALMGCLAGPILISRSCSVQGSHVATR